MKKSLFPHALSVFIIGLFFIFNQSINAQSPLDGFDPNANGTVRTVAVQPDGKILIGGEFTTVSPNGGAAVTRNRLARFNPDGTLDTAFNPNPGSTVNFLIIWSIVVQPDGKILVGGSFSSIGGQPRNNIARLDAITGLADSFNPNANGAILSIAVQTDGKVVVGGSFQNIGGQQRAFVGRLDATTGLADSFNPGTTSYFVFVVAIQPDGKILVGGAFATIGGQPRRHLARFDPITGLLDSFNPDPDYAVLTIAFQPDGKILVGGVFNSIGGQSRSCIARLDKDTGLADSFNPGDTNNEVRSMVVQTDGKVLVSGQFNIIGGYSRNGIARLDAVTGAVDSFNPNTNGSVYAIAVQPDGKILAGGNFTSAAPNGGVTSARNSIARFERDGLLDQTLNLNMLGNFVIATAVQPDGKILIGGRFTSVLGSGRNNIARLNTDGTLDTNFNPDAGGRVNAIAVQPDGKILVGGDFTYIGGQLRNRLARLDKDTGLADSFNPYPHPSWGANAPINTIAIQPDGKVLVGGAFTSFSNLTRNHIARLDATTGYPDSFNPNASHSVSTITIQPDGKILVGGGFLSIGGQMRNFIARLDEATGQADSFNPNSNGWVNSIVIQSDGKILVGGGDFNNIGGQPRNRLARLDAVTGLADSFNPNANGAVFAIAIQSDGKILAGGYFTNAGGQSRNRLARFDATTGAVDSFNPSANSPVWSIAIQSDGKILAAGEFSNIGGQTRIFFARLTNDTAAFSTLSVSRTTVNLTRDGSAAQFRRVVFELSTDNGANWTTLGTAANSFASSSMPTGTNETSENQSAPLAPEAAAYTLTGLNLPTGQNILIRARGYLTFSASIEDKVQTAFLLVPTAAQVSVSGRVLNADGSGLRNASVMLTDANGNTRSAVTGSFGYFRFDDVQAGETYVVSVVAKGYQFAPQAVTVNEELSELNFTAQQ